MIKECYIDHENLSPTPYKIVTPAKEDSGVELARWLAALSSIHIYYSALAASGP